MISEAVWEAVQAALDARRDPLEDEAVREHLLSHPEDLAALDRLTDRLAALARGELAPEASAGTPSAVPLSLSRDRPATGRPASSVARRWVAMVVGQPGRSAAAAAAALLLALVFSWHPVETSRLPTPPLPSAGVPAPPAVARVLSWKITVSKIDGSGITREISQPSGFLATHRAARPSSQQPVRSLSLAWTDSWTRP